MTLIWHAPYVTDRETDRQMNKTLTKTKRKLSATLLIAPVRLLGSQDFFILGSGLHIMRKQKHENITGYYPIQEVFPTPFINNVF